MKYKKLLVLALSAMLLTACGEKDTGKTESPVVESKELKEQESEAGPGNDATAEPQTEVLVEEVAKENRVTAEGPYGAISMTIPEGWFYEICETDDDKLGNCNYGLIISDTEDMENTIEVGYCPLMGLCGTGLEQEEVTLAGETAYICRYDRMKYFDFICFAGEMDGIWCFRRGMEGEWVLDKWDDIMAILDTVSLDVDHKSGGIGIYENSSECEKLNLHVEARKVSKSGADIRFYCYMEPDGYKELGFSDAFVLEKKLGDWYEELPVVIDGDYGFNAPLYNIPIEDFVTHHYDWEWLYGSLEPGDYRLGVDVLATKDDGSHEKVRLYASFIYR